MQGSSIGIQQLILDNDDSVKPGAEDVRNSSNGCHDDMRFQIFFMAIEIHAVQHKTVTKLHTDRDHVPGYKVSAEPRRKEVQIRESIEVSHPCS